MTIRCEVTGGIGDLLVHLPLIEQLLPEPCDIYAGNYFKGRGLEKLVTSLLPFVRCRFCDFWKRDLIGYSFKDSLVIDRARVLGVDPRYTLSEESRARLTPVEGMGDFILAHVRPSHAKRAWHGWGEMKSSYNGSRSWGSGSHYNGSRMIATGNPHETLPPQFGHSRLDFYDTAKLMLSCRGVVCVNSSMMNLANILGVKCISININEWYVEKWPLVNGVALVNPSVEDVERTICEFLFQN